MSCMLLATMGEAWNRYVARSLDWDRNWIWLVVALAIGALWIEDGGVEGGLGPDLVKGLEDSLGAAEFIDTVVDQGNVHSCIRV